jgi:hypothetical protein
MFAQAATTIRMQVYLYMAVDTRVEVANLQGHVTQTLTFAESEGVPLHIDINKGYLAVSAGPRAGGKPHMTWGFWCCCAAHVSLR